MLRAIISVVLTALAFAAIGFGLIAWRSQDSSVVETAALAGSMDPGVMELLRGQAAAAVMGWWGIVVLGIALAALAWLVIAGRRRPMNMKEAKSGGLTWWMLLAVLLLAAAGAGAGVFVSDVVAGGWRMGALIAGLLTAPLAYWLATAFGVSNEMAPSVPLASAVRS